MLSKIKVLLGISDTSKDDLLTVLLEQAITEAIEYTHNDDIEALDPAIVQMVLYKFSRLGTEGLGSEGYSGVSFTYAEDYPTPILNLLNHKRKIIVL